MRNPPLRANAVDAHVGSRVRTRRTLLGLSQSQIGNALGLSFQQLQKYERGSNRISASKLYQLSVALDVPVPYFFEDMPEELEKVQQPTQRESREEGKLDIIHRRETLELVRAYYQIDDADLRQRIRETVRALAGEQGRRMA